ncbi:MAG: hypothetical protein ACRC0G_00285 [Fusobacteriaceae bacterium]
MTITKNPIFLQSCTIVYSWFQSRITNIEDAKVYSMLEIAESDKEILENLDTDVRDKNRYENIEARYNLMKEALSDNS